MSIYSVYQYHEFIMEIYVEIMFQFWIYLWKGFCYIYSLF